MKMLNKEIIRYIIVGGLTTAINFGVHYICRHFFDANVNTAILISWFFSVLFAFITNKYIVFQKKGSTVVQFVREGALFFGARIGSLGIEYVMMFIFISLLNIQEGFAKFLTQFFILVANYILSKWIFKK